MTTAKYNYYLLNDSAFYSEHFNIRGIWVSQYFCKLNFYLEVNIPSFAEYSEKQTNSHI